MSKKTKRRAKERHERKIEYFEYLKETAEAVDPYVYSFVQDNFKGSKLEEKLLSRYSFGKPQLRPAIVRMSYELMGGRNWKKTIPACASMEAKETGYYCFDDILDLGEDPSLTLLGNIFSSISYRMLNDLSKDFKPDRIQKIEKELSEMDFNNAKAALIDESLKQSNPNNELYFQKAEGYNLWENVMKIGGILSNTSSKNIERLSSGGKLIGMGHIIANDTWDFGKDLEDFRAGKYTLPIISTFYKVRDPERKKLSSLFGKKNISEEQKDEIRKVVVKSGVVDEGKKKAEEYCNKGLKILNQFPDSRAKRMLNVSTTYTQRSKYYSYLDSFK